MAEDEHTDNQNAEGQHYYGGIKRPGVTTGEADPVKSRVAKKATGSSSMFREGGMMLDSTQETSPSHHATGHFDSYNTSYANGMDDTSGTNDIPSYFQRMNEQNGGMIYWPATLREKYSWFRYWSRCIFLNDNNLGQILMGDGTVRSIKDVEPGDEVMTGMGTVRPVKEKFERRCVEDNAVTIDAWCLQHQLKTTHHHPYWVLKRENVKRDSTHYRDSISFEPEWIHAENVRKGDYVLLPPLTQEETDAATEKQARMLGYYAAEGSIDWGERCVGTENGKGYKWYQEKAKVPAGIRFTINHNELDTLGKSIKEAVYESFGKNACVIRERKNVAEIGVSGRDIAEFCYKHIGTGSSTKKLSRQVLFSSTEAKRQFIIGYMGGDGCLNSDEKNRNKIVIGTSSPSLAHQVQMMAVSCGIMCRIAEYDRNTSSGYNPDNPTSQWHITIPAQSSKELIESSDKWEIHSGESQHHCAFMINGYAAFQVKDVSLSYEDDVVHNIEVDAEGDEKSFICNGMITHNSDAYIGRALELLSDLPMSKLSLSMPKEVPDDKKQEIHDFFSRQLDILDMFNLLWSILWEVNTLGNLFVFHEWNDDWKMWTKAVVLPPEEVYIFEYPFSNNARVEYRPEKLMEIIKSKSTEEGEEGVGDSLPTGEEGDRGSLNDEIMENIPQEIVDMVNEQDCIVMDTDPMSGSFVHHIARRKSPYMDLGASPLERVLIPMLQKEHYRFTQLSLASRNMTPKNLITAPGLMPEELDDLRTQVDLSYLDPDYSIITNYEVNWDQIGAGDRLLELSREYEAIDSQIFAALGVTRSLLTGEGVFSGDKITVEVLNTMFLLSREVLKEYVEKQLFLPIADAKGWYEEDNNGIRKYWYPKLGFNRLTIRDNAEVFDSLFQLYQKGSLPISVLWELFNLDPDDMNEQIQQDMFTVNDPTWNRMMEDVGSEVGRAIAEETDVVDRIRDYMGLEEKEEEGEEGGGRFGSAFGGSPTLSEPEPATPGNINSSEGIQNEQSD